MKNSHLIPGGKQLPVMSVHATISSSVQNHVFILRLLGSGKKALGNRRAKLPGYPYTY